MVFVVNMSLKMGAGKLAAQVGHATLGVYRLAQRSEDVSVGFWKNCQLYILYFFRLLCIHGSLNFFRGNMH